MSRLFRAVAIAFLLSAFPFGLRAQRPNPIGAEAPTQLPVSRLDKIDLSVDSLATVPTRIDSYFLSGVELLGEDFQAYYQVRVLAAHGPHAGLDSDALASFVFVALNLDGTDFTAYRLGPILDPGKPRITAESGKPVIYLPYGVTGKQCAKIEATLESVVVSAASSCR